MGAGRPAPGHGLRASLFGSWPNRLVTGLVGLLVLALLPGLVDWTVIHAHWQADADACRALDGAGACWGLVAEKYRLILFGRYPFAEQWRPAAGCVILVAALALAASGRRHPGIVLAWLGCSLGGFLALMAGGFGSLPAVESQLWGGLPLTLLLSIVGFAAALPLGILLALGRRSSLPLLRTLCASYVELVRGVPLISVLFMAAFLFPLFLPGQAGQGMLVRVLLAIVLFVAAYVAEVVRGGLQAIPAGQAEAARALGLGPWQVQRHVILPQALRAALPALVSVAIGIFKDVSLVTVVSLYELTGSLTLALAGDAQWRPFYLEGYLFVGLIYWLGCSALSAWGRRLERRWQF